VVGGRGRLVPIHEDWESTYCIFLHGGIPMASRRSGAALEVCSRATYLIGCMGGLLGLRAGLSPGVPLPSDLVHHKFCPTLIQSGLIFHI
jgi:hypothetical protein